MATRVKGLDKLKAQLNALPARAKAEAAQALAQQATQLTDAIAREHPCHRVGQGAGALGRGAGEEPPTTATGVIRSQAPSPKAAYLGKMGFSITILAGNDKAYYARWVEFGTSAAPAGRYQDAKGKTRTNKGAHHATPAQPFFYPTIRARQAQIRSRMVAAMRTAAKGVASDMAAAA